MLQDFGSEDTLPEGTTVDTVDFHSVVSIHFHAANGDNEFFKGLVEYVRADDTGLIIGMADDDEVHTNDIIAMWNGETH